MFKPSRISLKDKHVLLTGGSQGLGQQIALACAQKQVKKLFILDVSDCSETASLVRKHGVECETFQCNVANRKELFELADTILADTHVDIIISNAGIARKGWACSQSEETFRSMFDVNFYPLVWLIQKFSDHLANRKDSVLCCIGSVSSWAPVPGMIGYGASKAALRTMQIGLLRELDLAGKRIHMLLVEPYHIKTKMFDDANPLWLVPTLTAADVASRVIRSIENRDYILMTPRIMYLLHWVSSITPQTLQCLTLKFMNGHRFLKDVLKVE